MIRKLEFSNKWNYYLCILLVPLLYEDLQPCPVMSSPKNRLRKKTQKRSYEKKHHQPMMLPVLVSSFLGIILTNPSPLKAKVVRAAWGNGCECELQQNIVMEIPYHTIKYIWEVWGSTFSVVLELTAASQAQ